MRKKDIGDSVRINRRAERQRQNQIGKYIKDVVYGGLDGLITTFAIVSGVAGASLSTSIILILGFANLIADGFSMAVGNYLGTKSEQEFAKKEREREEEYLEQDPEGAKDDLRRIFKRKGFDGKNLENMIAIITTNKKMWVDAIMQEDLGISDEQSSPLEAGITTFFSFFTIGMIPLSVYVLAVYFPPLLEQAFLVAIILTGVTIFCMGALKSMWTGVHWLKSGIEMLLIGGAAAVFAYIIGFVLQEFRFEPHIVNSIPL